MLVHSYFFRKNFFPENFGFELRRSESAATRPTVTSFVAASAGVARQVGSASPVEKEELSVSEESVSSFSARESERSTRARDRIGRARAPAEAELGFEQTVGGGAPSEQVEEDLTGIVEHPVDTREQVPAREEGSVPEVDAFRQLRLCSVFRW
jgi:hypothetical protein